MYCNNTEWDDDLQAAATSQQSTAANRMTSEFMLIWDGAHVVVKEALLSTSIWQKIKCKNCSAHNM